MFRLLRYFSIASLIAFIAVTVLLGVFYRNTAIQALIEQEESKNAAVTQTIANSVRSELAAHLAATAGLAPAELRTHPSTATLRRTIAAQRAGLPIAKIKIYNAAGITIFSTDESQIGEAKGANAGFQTALRGGVVSELTHRDSFSSFDGVQEDQDVLSTYLPVLMAAPEAHSSAVFELYSIVTPLLHRIDATERTIVTGAAAILLILYLMLFLIVRRADAIIRRQHEERLQAAATLRQQELALAAARERERLARELHDTVGQVLGYVSLQAQAAGALAERGQASDAHRLLLRLGAVVQQAQTDVREQIHVLQQGPTQSLDMQVALAGCIAQFRRRSNLHVEVRNAEVLQTSRLDHNAEVQLLGIVQEALTNVQKHARAQHAWVSFKLDGAYILVTVTDDGAGFAPDYLAEQPGRHFGLKMMCDRATEIGSVLKVRSTPGGGTRVEVRVPQETDMDRRIPYESAAGRRSRPDARRAAQPAAGARHRRGWDRQRRP
ncbi:MAG: sensor histidine kinase [Anaerolineales bacterium]|nr:sensor histidine kinase [Anaerolineales bacterium]